eukprot:SAG31_NODE_11287_length_1046_cov_1.137276_1_plen_149_part_00
MRPLLDHRINKDGSPLQRSRPCRQLFHTSRRLASRSWTWLPAKPLRKTAPQKLCSQHASKGWWGTYRWATKAEVSGLQHAPVSGLNDCTMPTSVQKKPTRAPIIPTVKLMQKFSSIFKTKPAIPSSERPESTKKNASHQDARFAKPVP